MLIGSTMPSATTLAGGVEGTIIYGLEVVPKKKGILFPVIGRRKRC